MLKHTLHIGFLIAGISFSCFCSAQVINPPYLHCVSVLPIPNQGDIQLDWTEPVNSCGPCSGYTIYWSNNLNGPYTPISVPFGTSYIHLVGNGGSVTYYYYMESDCNCPGATVLQSDTIDNLDPVTPQINFVTVTGGLAEINWEPSPSPETFGYIVYRVVGSTNNLDTVYGKFNTTYIDVNSTPGTDTMSYTVAAVDSCGNLGLYNELPQHTIYLKDTVLRCSQQIILNWTPYDRWQNGVDKYELLVSINGAPAVVYQTYGANEVSDTVTGFDDGDVLCMTIVASEKNSTFTSTSNEVCVQMNIVQPPNDFYVRNVTVTAPNTIEVKYSMDPLADITKITVERAVDEVSYTAIASFAPPADLSVINSFIDTTALMDQNSYYYRLIAIDSCNIHDTSTIGRSVLLQGYAFSDLSYYISWNESYFDHGSVLKYDVYRDDGTGFNLLSTLTPATLTYEEGNLASTATPCYYIDAIDSMNFPNGISDTIHSRSNVLCLNQPSQIYMANAFAPLGKNNTLSPILNVEGVKSFSFVIFNRWGEQIFSSDSPSDGWDGKYKGTYVQQGAYAYVVDVTDDKGKHIQAKGTVMVIR